MHFDIITNVCWVYSQIKQLYLAIKKEQIRVYRAEWELKKFEVKLIDVFDVFLNLFTCVGGI